MKSKNVKIPIYGGTLKLKIVKNWKKLNKMFDCNYNSSVDGCAYHMQKEDGTTTFHIEFLGIPSTATMVHESVHLVNRVFHNRGVELDTENDEAQAYFTEWVFEQVEEFIEQVKLLK